MSQHSSDGMMAKGGLMKSAMRGNPLSPDFKSTTKTAPSFNLGSPGAVTPVSKNAPTAEKLKALDKDQPKRASSAAPSARGSVAGGKRGSVVGG